MDITVCDREGGCQTQFGQFPDSSGEMIVGYVERQEGYMGNNCTVEKRCTQICGTLGVVLDEVEVPGEVITGVRVSGMTRDGTMIDGLPGVAYVDENKIMRTQIIK